MPDIQIAFEDKHRLLQAHQKWTAELPRDQGQLGSEVTTLVEAPPIYIPGEVTVVAPEFPDRVRFVSLHG